MGKLTTEFTYICGEDAHSQGSQNTGAGNKFIESRGTPEPGVPLRLEPYLGPFHWLRHTTQYLSLINSELLCVLGAGVKASRPIQDSTACALQFAFAFELPMCLVILQIEPSDSSFQLLP